MATNPQSASPRQVWRQWILSAAIEEPSTVTEHPWICYTYSEKQERQISILSPTEYKELSSKNSFWRTHCEKMPLNKIIAISEALRINTPATPDGFCAAIFFGNVFSVDMDCKSFVDEHVQKLEKEYNDISQAIQVLKTMCERSLLKRVLLKTQGIWVRVKFYIYSWFSQSPQVKNLEITTLPELTNGMLANAVPALKSRVAMNIELFEKELPEQDRITRNPTKELKDVKKILASYGPDKMPKVTEDADVYRTRILALYTLWAELVKHQNSAKLRNHHFTILRDF